MLDLGSWKAKDGETVEQDSTKQGESAIGISRRGLRDSFVENLKMTLHPGGQVKSGSAAGYDRKPGGVRQPCWNHCWKVTRIKVMPSYFHLFYDFEHILWLFWIGMYRQKCQTLRMRRVMREFQERGIFGGPSWAPQLPNTTSQSELTLTVIFV